MRWRGRLRSASSARPARTANRQVDRAFALALGRAPEPAERKAALRYLEGRPAERVRAGAVSGERFSVRMNHERTPNRRAIAASSSPTLSAASAAWRSRAHAGHDANPLAPKRAEPAKAKSVIFLFMAGGPSHLETFDPKPLLNKLNGQPRPEGVRRGQAPVHQRRAEAARARSGRSSSTARAACGSRTCCRTRRRARTIWR